MTDEEITRSHYLWLKERDEKLSRVCRLLFDHVFVFATDESPLAELCRQALELATAPSETLKVVDEEPPK